MVKFENREIWADLENRSKVVHSENFPIWRPASGDRDHVTHHVTSHVTHWGQWKYASRSWHAVGNHRRQLKLMYRSKISGRGPKHCSGSKFQCRPRPANSAGCFYQVEAGPIFSGHWIPYLFFRTSPDIIGYSRCPDFSGHVRRPTQLPKLTRLLTSAISVAI